ncbi:MAG: hypothetical protein CV089_23900 [Nitrospira sp. WS110]|nr:hypothetical protein [Nitrospira sp. WS110]
MAPTQRKFADLPPKHQAFIFEYLHDLNATQAYIRAGYKAKEADVCGPTLLGKLRSFIDPLVASKASRLSCSADQTMSAIAEIALCTPLAEVTWRDKLYALQLMAKFHRLLNRTPAQRGLTVVFQSVRSGNDRAVNVEERPQIEGKKAVTVAFTSIPAGKPNGKGNGHGKS